MRKKVFIFYIIATIFFFGILVKLEYATDTYAVFNFDSNEIYMQYAMLGRFVTAIVGKIIKIIKLSEKNIYLFSYGLALICTILSEFKLYKIIEKDVKSAVLKLLIPPLVVANFFSIELFLFIEKGIMCFGVLMCIFAIDMLVKFFEIFYTEKKYLYIFFSIAFMFIANCSYQGIVRNICCYIFSIYFEIF